MMNEGETTSHSGGSTLTYRDYLWDKFPEVWEKVRQGKHSIRSLSALFKEHADMHKKLAKTYQDCKVTTNYMGQLQDPLAKYAEFCATIQAAHSHIAQELDKNIIKECEAMRKEISKSLKDSQTQEKKLRKELEQAEDTVRKAKKNDMSEKKSYEKAWAELQKMDQDPQTKPPKLQKAQQTLQKQDAAQKKAEQEYRQSVEKLKETNSRFYRELGDLMQRIEELDRKRLAFVRSIMTNYSDLHAQGAQNSLAAAQGIEVSFKAIDVEADVHSFVSSTQSGLQPPEPATFEPYIIHLDGQPYYNNGTGEDASDVASTPSSSFSRPAAAVSAAAPTVTAGMAAGASGFSSKSAAVSDADEVSSNASARSGGAAAGNPGTTAAGSGKKVEALYDYEPQGDGELQFRAGDIISVLEACEDGWWVGEIAKGSKVGSRGFFPSNFVQPAAAAAAAAAPGGGSKSSAAAPSAAAPAAAVAAASMGTCIAVYDYEATDPAEVSFKQGEIITILDKAEDGWWTGRVASGMSGLFPSNYTQPN